MRQLTFFDVHLPVCIGCKRAVALVAQWSPGDRIYLCRECSSKYPCPMEAFELHGKSPVGVRLKPDHEYFPLRHRYHSMAQSLMEMKKGCVMGLDEWGEARGIPCEYEQDACYSNCPRCLNKARYATKLQQAALAVAAQRNRAPEPLPNRYTVMMANVGRRPAFNLAFPICQRCSAIHDRKYDTGEHHPYCQQCDDELAVLSFWRNKGIFGQDDDETILDRIQRSHTALFERGVLPDMWYRLRIVKDVVLESPQS